MIGSDEPASRTTGQPSSSRPRASSQDHQRRREPLMCYNPVSERVFRYSPNFGRWYEMSFETLSARNINVEELPPWRENGNTCQPSPVCPPESGCVGTRTSQKRVAAKKTVQLDVVEPDRPSRTRERGEEVGLSRRSSPYPIRNLFGIGAASVRSKISSAISSTRNSLDTSPDNSSNAASRHSNDSSRSQGNKSLELRRACHELLMMVKRNEIPQEVGSPRQTMSAFERQGACLEGSATTKVRGLKATIRGLFMKLRRKKPE